MHVSYHNRYDNFELYDLVGNGTREYDILTKIALADYHDFRYIVCPHYQAIHLSS